LQLQVVPASHVPASALWHFKLHVPLPHVSAHFAALSEHSVVQPLGQLTEHSALPWQVTVEPAPTVTWVPASLLPEFPCNEILLSGPASMIQAEPPLHDATQPAPQFVVHADCDEHVLLQPVPHVVLHVLVWHWNVTLLGGAAAPPSLTPRTQFPPEHVQRLPSQAQPAP
jgi:hypothetical protein